MFLIFESSVVVVISPGTIRFLLEEDDDLCSNYPTPGVSDHLIAVVEHKSLIYSNTILALRHRWKS